MAAKTRGWKQVTQKLDLETVITECVLSKRAERSPRTAHWYELACGYFLQFLKDTNRGTRLADVGISDARAFVVSLQTRPKKGTDQPLSSHTINCWVRALRGFFSWLYQNDYTDEHRLKNLRPPKPTIEEIEILRPEQIQALLDACSPRTHAGCRNRAIVMVMLDGGLRLDEVATLRADDVHLEDGWLRVKGKGNKERIVPFGRNLQQVLLRYRTTFRPAATGQPERFILSLAGEPLTAWGIEGIVQRLGKAAGVPTLHPHLLRHTFATNYLLYNCGDAFRLQQILGHTTLEMTRRYVHMAGREKALQTTPISPTDRLGVSLSPRKSRKTLDAKPGSGRTSTPEENSPGEPSHSSSPPNAGGTKPASPKQQRGVRPA